jgi:hypothetical protein
LLTVADIKGNVGATRGYLLNEQLQGKLLSPYKIG